MPKPTDAEFLNGFRRRLRYAMASKFMSSADIVRASRLGSGQVSEYLNGHRCPKIDSLNELCKALDVSADFLIGLSPYPKIRR